MSEAAPPTPPHPKAVASHAKGFLSRQPKWVWIAGVATLIGVAYMVYKRQQNQASAALMDPTSVDGPSVDPGFVTAAPTQGAFGGFDSAQGPVGDPAADPATTNQDTPAQQPTFVFNVGPGGVTSGVAPTGDPATASPAQNVVPAAYAAAPTGGGTQPARAVSDHWTPPPPGVYAGVPYDASGAPMSTPTVASVLATGSLKGTNIDLNTETAPPGFPHKGPHGWYRIEQGGGSHKGHQVHVYQNGLKVYI